MTEDELLKKLGERIIELREERGFTQAEFARKLDIEDSSLRRIESGRTNPTTKTLHKIATTLHIHIQELFVNND
ncbi:helix-turn-helix transcriptional regulator [bacterium]|nr:helix-turn-helix transcriptional regulator [bacterium]